KLPGSCQAARSTQSRARGGTSLCCQWHRRRHSLPPGGAHRWIDLGLSMGRCAQARFVDTGEGRMTRLLAAEREAAPPAAAGPLTAPIAAIAGAGIAAPLDTHVSAATRRLLTP